MKTRNADLVEGSYHAPLPKSPISVEGARADVAAYAVLRGMVDLLVLTILEASRHNAVRLGGIGVYRVRLSK
jgi:hypothetical protein